MAQQIAIFVQLLEKGLQQGDLKDLLPFFELVGSMAEGTRIGLANEQDLALKFKAWMSDGNPFKVEGDPFSLKKARKPTAFMEQFFVGTEFQFHKFMHGLLKAVDKVVSDIFDEEKNPPCLKRVTTNKEWEEGKTPCQGACKRNLQANGFKQCEKCAVTVSQTKSGVALQFEYHVGDVNGSKKIYCSIDLIPVFQIEHIPTLALTRFIVEHMLCDEATEGWLQFIFKYYKDYKIILYSTRSCFSEVLSVGLKTMTFFEGRNHHIKPAQEFTEEKFSSPRMKDIYSFIKFLKKVLHLDLSSYWVKKELLKPEYELILDSCTEGVGGVFGSDDQDDMALVHILAQPEFMIKVESKIDFANSLKYGYVILK